MAEHALPGPTMTAGAGPVVADPPDVHRARVEVDELTGAGFDLADGLTRLVELTCAIVPGVDGASVVVGHPLRPRGSSSSSPSVGRHDVAQRTAGCGPSVDAYDWGRPVITFDVATDGRWPALRERPSAEVPAGCVSAPVRTRAVDGRGVVGVCTIYGPPAALAGPASVQQAERLAGRALSLITTAHKIELLLLAEQTLREDIGAYSAIDHAEGIVMADSGCSAEKAYRILRRLADASGRSLEEIAHGVLTAHARRLRDTV